MSIKTQNILKPFGFKRCAACGEIKPRNADYYSRHKTHEFCTYCKACSSIQKSVDYQKNIDANREKRRKYSKDNYEKVTRKQKEWRVNNPERHKHNRRNHYLKNVDKYHFSVNSRIHKKRANGGSFTEEEITLLFEKQHGLCFYCWGDISTGFVKDHWIPVNKGGDSWIDNIRLSCAECNGSKSDKMPYEWKGRL